MEKLRKELLVNPIISGQLTDEEINLSSKDINRPLKIIDKEVR